MSAMLFTGARYRSPVGAISVPPSYGSSDSGLFAIARDRSVVIEITPYYLEVAVWILVVT